MSCLEWFLQIVFIEIVQDMVITPRYIILFFNHTNSHLRGVKHGRNRVVAENVHANHAFMVLNNVSRAISNILKNITDAISNIERI